MSAENERVWLIPWRERQRRIRRSIESAWSEADRTPDDPGLRDAYAFLPRAPIRLIACPLVKDVNQGGLLRLAEAFRLQRVDLSPEADGGTDFSGHRGARALQPFGWSSPEEAILAAREAGCRVLALTLNDRAVALESVVWTFPIALVLGEESVGVPPEIEALCDGSVAIPLFGMVTSINVATAAAIAIHAAVQAYRMEDPDFMPARSASQRLLEK